MKNFARLVTVLISIVLMSCGSNKENTSQETSKPGQQSISDSELSPWETTHGIGPVKTEITLGKIDNSLAVQGGKIFEMKCMACHKMDERYVGPPIRKITQNRTPEYIMNMILNPDEMVKKHPDVKKLLAEYMTPMTFQNVTHEEARAILEYLRLIAQEKTQSN